MKGLQSLPPAFVGRGDSRLRPGLVTKEMVMMRLSSHLRLLSGMLFFVTGVAFTPTAASCNPAPAGLVAEELGVIDFTVSASLVPPVLSLTADLSTLPLGNTAVFTPAPDNMSGTFRWSPSVGSEGAYVISFVTTNAGGSKTEQTTLSILQSGISARAIGQFYWLGPLGGPENYTASFSATDQSGTSSLDIPLTVANYGCCVSGICQDGRTLPDPKRAAGALKATASLPVMSWSGNPDGYYWCFPYCCYESVPVDLTVEAYSTTPASDLDLTSSFFEAGAFSLPLVMRDPRMTAPATIQGDVMKSLAIEVAASDPDGDAISALTADFSGLPAGNNAEFIEGQTHVHGTMTWSPELADSGDYTVTFQAANLMSATTTTSIHVRGASEAITAVETGSSVFAATLHQNPLGPDSRLQYTTTRPGPVRVSLFDSRGRLVRELQPSLSLAAGRHEVPIREVDGMGRRLGSGIYFYRIESSEGALVGRLAVLK